MNRRTTNWAGNIGFGAERVHRPTTVAQLQAVVARAERARALGSGHSFNSVADTPGDLVSLADLPRTMELDTAAGTVQVGAGVRYAELAQWLQERGRALHNLGSLPHISVAGSCATATHGSGDANGNLATEVEALELVTAGGDLAVLSRAEHGAEFDGMVVALGALGVVTSMTLRTRPDFDVAQRVYERLPLEAFAEHFDEIAGAAYSVSLFNRWREPVIDQVWTKHRTSDPLPPGTESGLFGALPAPGPRHPIPEMSTEHSTEQLGAVGPWSERLPHFRPGSPPSTAGNELQAEYLMPRSNAAAALQALEPLRSELAGVVLVHEIRTIAADGLWLSPSFGQDTVAFHFTLVPDSAAVLAVLERVEERLAPFGAVPHWGKLFTAAPGALRERYSRVDDFTALADRFDPHGKFRNEFLQRHIFGGA
ncbi:alditol oxidase [Streptomonospora sediminis]